MNNYADEIRADVAHYHGERFAPKQMTKSHAQEISESLAIYNAMTEVERDAILYLQLHNFAELQALYKRVKEREGI